MGFSGRRVGEYNLVMSAHTNFGPTGDKPDRRRLSMPLALRGFVVINVALGLAAWTSVPTWRVRAFCDALDARDANRLAQLEGVWHDAAYMPPAALHDPTRTVMRYDVDPLTIE